MGKRLTTEEFTKKAKEVHGDKYDYSKVEYVNNKTKVCIICPKHGEFWQTPEHHINGHGCKKCQYELFSEERRDSLETWIDKSNKTHNGKYDYSKVKDINNGGKVCIICPEHGEFWQTPIPHSNGKGCPKCGRIKANKSESLTTEEFVIKASKVHEFKYDYSRVNYKNWTEKICIICPKHGEFWQSPRDHLKGAGCQECKKEKLRKLLLSSVDRFIEKSKKIHSNKYDYSKVVYSDTKTKVCIICPKHGEFWQSPAHHASGVGCPLCRESSMEKEICLLLNNNGFKFERQYRNKKLGNLSLDFYLPEYKIAIECQGEQHFEPVEHFGGEKKFEETIKRDKIKKEICENNGVRLLYFARKQYSEDILADKEQLLDEIKK